MLVKKEDGNSSATTSRPIIWTLHLCIEWGKSNHPMFFCCYFFVIKNFDSACDISLSNALEFILSSRENDIGQVPAARVDDHTNPFYGIFQNFRGKVFVFLANIFLKDFKSLRFVDVLSTRSLSRLKEICKGLVAKDI